MCVYIYIAFFFIHLFKWQWLFGIGLGKTTLSFISCFIGNFCFLNIFWIRIFLANSQVKWNKKVSFLIYVFYEKEKKNYNTIVRSRFWISFFILLICIPSNLQFVLNLIQSNSEIWIQFFYKSTTKKILSCTCMSCKQSVKILWGIFKNGTHTLLFWKMKWKCPLSFFWGWYPSNTRWVSQENF